MPAQFAYTPMVTTTSSTATTWMNWNLAYSNGTGTVTQLDTTWNAWNASYSGNTVIYGGQISTGQLVAAVAETEEQRADRERREEEFRRVREEECRQREAAKGRAEELLLSMLTDEQARTYKEKGWFEVRGSKGGRWRIRNRGQSGNVDLMPEIGEEREATYCAHPPEYLPDADAQLAQMLHLVTDEEGFVKVANRHWHRGLARDTTWEVPAAVAHAA